MWAENRPIWETEPHKAERVEIPIPDNPAELLTLQSRRLLLKQSNGRVTGYYILGGDFFRNENVFTEQMTIWNVRDNKDGRKYYVPKQHRSERQMWRDFDSLAAHKDNGKIPGVIEWFTRLQERDILSKDLMIVLRTAAVRHDSAQHSSITDEFGDSLSFSAALLTEKGRIWQDLVLDEIERCEKRAYWVGILARDLVRAAGGDEKEETSQSGTAKEKFFYRLDLPFRNWLTSLKPEQGGSEREEKQREWNETVGRIARSLGRELVEESGPAAFAGREVEEIVKGKKDTENPRHYSAPEALNQFLYRMSRIEKEG